MNERPRRIDLNDGFPHLICLCGSSRFKDEFIRKNREFTASGVIVLTMGWFGHVEHPPSDAEKIKLDELHKRKIDLADTVYVINKDGYVGTSTLSEITYARDNHKPVVFMEPVLTLFRCQQCGSERELKTLYPFMLKPRCNGSDSHDMISVGFGL